MNPAAAKAKAKRKNDRRIEQMLAANDTYQQIAAAQHAKGPVAEAMKLAAERWEGKVRQ